MQLLRLDHLQLCIPPGAEDEARAFYIGVLGFVEIPKPESLRVYGGLWLQAADIQLHLGVEEAQGRSKRHPAFEVADVAACRRELEAAGVHINDEVVIPGLDRFSFLDPFGNRIELLRRFP